jgi:hypothetical protein
VLTLVSATTLDEQKAKRLARLTDLSARIGDPP